MGEHDDVAAAADRCNEHVGRESAKIVVVRGNVEQHAVGETGVKTEHRDTRFLGPRKTGGHLSGVTHSEHDRIDSLGYGILNAADE